MNTPPAQPLSVAHSAHSEGGSTDADLIDAFIPHMRAVGTCERRMGELNFTWSLIESTAKMTCPVEAKTILPTMAATRRGFGDLERQLIGNLVHENARKVHDDLALRSQVVIDILIRNLYERTADVGFLATDAELRAFAKAGATDPRADHSATAQRVRERLEEYRAKYTVYDEIVVLDPHGAVLARLDETVGTEESTDPIVAAALASDRYVEAYRASDLRPCVERALLYARRIDDPATGKAVGVLVLSFRFDDEMNRIFDGLRSANERAVMLLLDPDGKVIASSNPDHVAVGRRVETVLDDAHPTIEFSGREYLAVTRATRGYEGYFGQGWRGHLMTPVDGAFRSDSRRALDNVSPALLESVLAQADTFAPTLGRIAAQAERINLSLRRVVWNGQIMAADKSRDLVRLKSILQQISETGTRTSTLFASSIRELYGTVVSTNLGDARSIAHLAIDVMDRNLYERADDCRWWALTTELRTTLAADAIDAKARERINAVLATINGLYTVYPRLVVYDRHGTIVAASNLHADALDPIGTTIPELMLRAVLQLRSTQDYCVSPFEPSALYGDRPTYVYHAAIRHPDHAAAVVGGIGIVFDSAPQFTAMLRDALPARAGAFGLFVDRAGQVIASTDPATAPGSKFEIDTALLKLENGAAESRLLTCRGTHYIVGHAASAGYREYKTTGDYVNDVVALVFVPIGAAQPNAARRAGRADELTSVALGHSDAVDFAIFAVDDQLYGVAATNVLEAVEPEGLVPVREAQRMLAGLITYQSSGAEPNPVVPVIDMRHLLGCEPAAVQAQQIVVLQSPRGPIGLLVDDLSGVLELDARALQPVLPAIERHAGIIKSIVKIGEGDGARLLMLLNTDGLFAKMQRIDPVKDAALVE